MICTGYRPGKNWLWSGSSRLTLGNHLQRILKLIFFVLFFILILDGSGLLAVFHMIAIPLAIKDVTTENPCRIY